VVAWLSAPQTLLLSDCSHQHTLRSASWKREPSCSTNSLLLLGTFHLFRLVGRSAASLLCLLAHRTLEMGSCSARLQRLEQERKIKEHEEVEPKSSQVFSQAEKSEKNQQAAATRDAEWDDKIASHEAENVAPDEDECDPKKLIEGVSASAFGVVLAPKATRPNNKTPRRPFINRNK
jgi:hypothetical protein